MNVSPKLILKTIEESGVGFSNAKSHDEIKEKINTKDELNILNNIFKFYNNNKLYLFIDNNNFLFNGKRYKFRDIAITETLYWIVQYKYS